MCRHSLDKLIQHPTPSPPIHPLHISEHETHICPRSNLWFVHVPKAGGGTIEDSICHKRDRYSRASHIESVFKYKGV